MTPRRFEMSGIGSYGTVSKPHYLLSTRHEGYRLWKEHGCGSPRSLAWKMRHTDRRGEREPEALPWVQCWDLVATLKCSSGELVYHGLAWR